VVQHRQVVDITSPKAKKPVARHDEGEDWLLIFESQEIGKKSKPAG
jgi:hypothetical protein